MGAAGVGAKTENSTPIESEPLMAVEACDIMNGSRFPGEESVSAETRSLSEESRTTLFRTYNEAAESCNDLGTTSILTIT